MARNFGAINGIGTSDNVTSSLTTHATYRTWSWWVNPRSTANGEHWNKGNGVECVSSSATSGLIFKRALSTTYEWRYTAPTVGVWTHVVVTYNQDTPTTAPIVYYNGAVQTNQTTVTATGAAQTNTTPVVIGNRAAADRAYDGTLAEFAIWDRILRFAEIQALARGASPLSFAVAISEYIPLDVPTISKVRPLWRPTVVGTKPAAHPKRISDPGRTFFFFFQAVPATETPTSGNLSFTGIASSIIVAQPKGAFSHTYVNAAVLPSRRYGSFAGKSGSFVDFSITPARGLLGLTGIALSLSQGFIIAPPVGALTMTGFAPVVVRGTILTTLVGSMGFTGISSTLLVENIIRGPPLAALATTGTIPTVIQAAIISPVQGSLAAAGQSPTQIQSIFITPPKGNLTGSGFTIGAAGGMAPSTASANFTGTASVLKFEIFITPPAGSATATGLAPTLIQAAILAPPAGSGSFTGLFPGLLRGSVGLPPAGSLGASGFGSLIQLVTFIPAGSLAITGNNASVNSTGVQTQRTQLGPRFIPAKRYKLQGFANKFGTQQELVPAAALTISGNAPTIIKSYVPALAPLVLTGFAPGVSISTLGDRFVTPPAGSLSATGRAPNAIIGSTKKTQLSSRFIPGRRYGRFDSKAGININIAPSCGGGIRINYLVDGLGNYIVDEAGNYILSYNDQAGTTAVFNSFLPKVQVSVLVGITISPSRGSLAAISAAPSVRLDRFITPPKGDFADTGRAPTASVATVITPPAGALGISGAAPNSGIAYFLTPPRGSLQATGLLSTVFIGSGVVGNIVFAPSNAVLSATGFQPLTKTAAITSQGQLSIGGFAPTVSISTVIIPPRAQIFALGQFPVPARSTVITPPAGSLSAASAAVLQAIQTTVPAAQFGLTGYAPFVTTETGLRVTSGSLAATGFAPAQIATLSAPAGQASFTGFSPQIPKLFIPAAGQIGITGFPPLFKLPEVILINLKGAAVGTLTLHGKLIGDAQLSGNAIATVVITQPKE